MSCNVSCESEIESDVSASADADTGGWVFRADVSIDASGDDNLFPFIFIFRNFL